MKAGLRRHADTHDPEKGSDPIRGNFGWNFDIDNEGGFGYLQFNDCFDLDFFPNPLARGGDWGGVIVDASGCGLLIGSTSTFGLIGRPAFVHSEAETMTIVVGATSPVTFTFNHDGTITLPSGAVIGP